MTFDEMPAIPQVFVHSLPEHVAPDALADATVVVTDVLRATTTIAYALAAGAAAVIPTLEIDEARRRAAELPPGTAILGGERQGIRIEGFDLGNSPREYGAERVRGKTVVFTTTNGTKAMLRCRAARRILLGAFVNLSAVAEAAGQGGPNGPIHLVCAGTRGEITAEDVLFAGACANLLAERGFPLSDSALLAQLAWQRAAGLGPLAQRLRDTQGGRNLQAEGFDADIDTAGEFDTVRLVPRYDPASGQIRAS